MASDGVFDVLSSAKAVAAARNVLKHNASGGEAAATTVCNLAQKLGSSDNCSCIIITLP